jgi:uncharacterized protein with HEPN domain
LRSRRRSDDERIADILEAIDRIQRWDSERQSADMHQAAVLHELMIIGEAASHLSDDFKQAHPNIPWKDVIGQRAQLAHHYWDTQWARIQQTLAEDIPTLKAALTTTC